MKISYVLVTLGLGMFCNSNAFDEKDVLNRLKQLEQQVASLTKEMDLVWQSKQPAKAESNKCTLYYNQYDATGHLKTLSMSETGATKAEAVNKVLELCRALRGSWSFDCVGANVTCD